MSTYAQLCPIIYGQGSIQLLGEETKKLGCSKVMLVSGKNMVKSPTYAQCKENLLASGLEIVEFNEIVPDPPDTIINQGGELAKRENIDGIVAIGGGSPMDAAKAINVLVNNPLPVSLYYGNPFYKPGVPVVMVVTTAGTGSESTIIGVVTDTENNVKNSVIGAASLGILDPDATVSLSPQTTAHTGMDAFTHAAEAITAKIGNPKSELLATDAIKKIVRALPLAIQDGSNIEARGDLLLASNFAGMAFNDALVHLGHAIAHSVGAKYHLTHGGVCALALPEVMIYAADVDASKVKIVGEAMGLSFHGNESSQEIATTVAQAIRDFSKSIGIQSFKELGLKKEDITSLAAMVRADGCYHFVPKDLSEEEVAQVLANMYDNY